MMWQKVSRAGAIVACAGVLLGAAAGTAGATDRKKPAPPPPPPVTRPQPAGVTQQLPPPSWVNGQQPLPQPQQPQQPQPLQPGQRLRAPIPAA